MDKKDFLKTGFIKLLSTLSSEQKGKWGVLNAQQMVEHMSDAFRNANGKEKHTVVLTPEQVQKAYGFMMMEKPFKENTKNQLMPEIPVPAKNKDMEAALAELQTEINDFFKEFETANEQRITNPFFGELNFQEWVHLLHKHATHHARQFNLVD